MSEFLKVVGKALLETYNEELDNEISADKFGLVCTGIGSILGVSKHDQYEEMSKEIEKKERRKKVIDKVLKSL